MSDPSLRLLDSRAALRTDADRGGRGLAAVRTDDSGGPDADAGETAAGELDNASRQRSPLNLITSQRPEHGLAAMLEIPAATHGLPDREVGRRA